MESSTETFQTSPPRLIASVVAGFNTVANHAYLILFPIFLDLVLWFGPHIRIKTLFQPLVDAFFKEITSSTINVADMQDLIQKAATKLDGVNLLAGLRSWPIGIPSLFSFSFDKVMITPIGTPLMVDLPTMASVFLFSLLVIVVGIFAGSVFFNSISNASIGLKKQFSLSLLFWQFKQSLFLTLLLFILLLLIALPVSFILFLFTLFQLLLFGYILISFLLLWILLPLVFSAHGIFMFKLNAVNSIATSVRLVRSYLPGTMVFLLAAFFLNEIMNILWRIPPADSWMTLIGVAGHAFIASGLLAASFIYYGSGMRWMQENLQHIAARQSKA